MLPSGIPETNMARKPAPKAEKSASLSNIPEFDKDQELAAYRVLSEGGWWDVVKCRSCLASVERRRGPLLGPLSEVVQSLVPGQTPT